MNTCLSSASTCWMAWPKRSTATPPLARDDYLHFTRQGGAIKGAALSDALLLEYDWSRQ